MSILPMCTSKATEVCRSKEARHAGQKESREVLNRVRRGWNREDTEAG